MSKLSNNKYAFNLVLLALFVFIFLPLVKTGFTIDSDLAPKFFITCLFLFMYSAYLFFFGGERIEINGGTGKIFLMILLMLAWMFIELFPALNRGEALLEFLRIAVLYSFFFISFIVFHRSSHPLEILCRAAAFAVLIFIATGVFQLFAPNVNLTDGGLFSRLNAMTSSLANKNFFSEVLVLMLPFLIVGVITNNFKWKVFIIVMLILDLTTVFFLQTVAAWIAIFFSVIFYIILSKKYGAKVLHIGIQGKQKSIVTITLILLLIVVGFCSTQTENYQVLSMKVKRSVEYLTTPSLLSTTRAENNNSVFERLVIWRNSIHMIQDHPLMGVGLNNWKIFNPLYGIGGTDYTNTGYVNYEHPHNDYLLIWAEQGPIGIIFYILLFVLVFLEGFRIIKRQDKNSQILVIVLLSGIFSFMILSLFAYPRSRFYSMILLMIFYALVVSWDKEKSTRTIPVKLIMILIFICSAFGAIASSYRIIGERHTKKLQIFQLRQNFSRMIGEADKAYSWYYPMDLTSTPLSWYKGMAYFDSGLKKDAIREYENALKINPNHLRLLNDIATTYEQSNMRDQAIFYYRKALKISPFFIEANLNISAAYYNSNNIDSAFYFIDRIYNASANMDGIINYKEFLDAILYSRSLELLKAEKDSVVFQKALSLIGDKDSLKHIYKMSKDENQPFAKFLLSYSGAK